MNGPRWSPSRGRAVRHSGYTIVLGSLYYSPYDGNQWETIIGSVNWESMCVGGAQGRGAIMGGYFTLSPLFSK